MGKRIVVVGSINLDLVARSPKIPSPGETVSGTDFRTFFGGKGANQAVAVAKLGHPVTMIGRVGEDAFGAQLIDGLRAAGVRTDCVMKSFGSSGVALIVTDKSGENSIVVVPGANGELLPADLERNDGLLAEAGMILSQLEVPLETVEYLADRAAAHRVPLMLDPAPAQLLPRSIYPKVEWLTPNETEARILCNGRGDADGTDGDVVHRFLSLGVKHVILKQGARGVFVKDGLVEGQRISGYAVDAIDTTAAGDAFNGGFAVAMMTGKSPLESAQFANAVAAISVTRAGAQTSMPTLAEVEAFLRVRSH